VVAQRIEQLDFWDKPKVIQKGRKHEPKPRHTVARILHLGAGVQSSCIAEMIVDGFAPPVDFVVFADTGDEPIYVYEQVQYLKERFAFVGIPLVIVKRPGLGIADQVMFGDGRFITMPMYTLMPDGTTTIVRRQCTNEFKIVPSDDYTKDWLVDHGYATKSQVKLSHKASTRRTVRRDVLVENIYGISVDEFQRAGKRGPEWQKAMYPLIDQRMTRNDCVKWLIKNGHPVPKKSSCKKCPFHSDEYWLDQSINYPSDFEESCQFDEFVRTPEGKKRFKGSMRGEFYLHPSCKPLRSIDFAARIEAKKSTPLFDSPMCGNHCHT
jgi:hypothetical protein